MCTDECGAVVERKKSEREMRAMTSIGRNAKQTQVPPQCKMQIVVDDVRAKCHPVELLLRCVCFRYFGLRMAVRNKGDEQPRGAIERERCGSVCVMCVCVWCANV